MSAWTQDRVDRLKVLWTQGLSCSQIAKDLGGVTRNAVIGKVTRLHLPTRQGSTRVVSPRAIRERRRMAAPSAPRPLRPPRLSSSPVGAPNGRRPPAKDETSILWIDHQTHKHCEMFCEGESGALGFVCGKEPMMKSVYCAACAGVAYNLQAPEKQEAA